LCLFQGIWVSFLRFPLFLYICDIQRVLPIIVILPQMLSYKTDTLLVSKIFRKIFSVGGHAVSGKTEVFYTHFLHVTLSDGQGRPVGGGFLHFISQNRRTRCVRVK